jgi:hypothetical protein
MQHPVIAAAVIQQGREMAGERKGGQQEGLRLVVGTHVGVRTQLNLVPREGLVDGQVGVQEEVHGAEKGRVEGGVKAGVEGGEKGGVQGG